MPNAVRINPNRVRSSGRGFSLIELITVMTVAAILAAVAVPAMTSTGSMRRRAAAAQTARDIRVARELGITTGRTAWISFDAAAESYALRLEPLGNPGRAQSVAWTDPATGRAFTQAFNTGEWVGVTIASASFGGGTWIGFDRLGRPLTYGESMLSTTGQVTLDGAVVVSVEPDTGRVAVTP